MFGRDWEPATAKVVAKRYHESSGTSGTWEFLVDVTVGESPPFRTSLKQPPLMSRMLELDEGATVPVLADLRRQKAKFDHDQVKSLGREVPFQKDRFEEASKQPPGTVPPPNPNSIESPPSDG
ncbi:MAG: hypothetical protein QOG99_85 [Frankiales bacterium]|nr:hypothetical protein [Frankiales bacterium]